MRVALSSFAAAEGFHETEAVTCLSTIKFSSMGEKENTSNFVDFNFLSTLEFKCKKKKNHIIPNSLEISIRC